MSNTLVFLKDDDIWIQCIGGLIVNFGVAEFASLQWIAKIQGNASMFKSRRDTLNEKIKTLRQIIPDSKLSESNKINSVKLWDEVISHAVLRNQIAHNPLCFVPDEKTGEVSLSPINVNKIDKDGVIKSPVVGYLRFEFPFLV